MFSPKKNFVHHKSRFKVPFFSNHPLILLHVRTKKLTVCFFKILLDYFHYDQVLRNTC